MFDSIPILLYSHKLETDLVIHSTFTTLYTIKEQTVGSQRVKQMYLHRTYEYSDSQENAKLLILEYSQDKLAKYYLQGRIKGEERESWKKNLFWEFQIESYLVIKSWTGNRWSCANRIAIITTMRRHTLLEARWAIRFQAAQRSRTIHRWWQSKPLHNIAHPTTAQQ